MRNRIERNGYLEVVLSEIETHRAQGEALGIECFQRDHRRKRIVWAIGTGVALYLAWGAYVLVVGTKILHVIGAR